MKSTFNAVFGCPYIRKYTAHLYLIFHPYTGQLVNSQKKYICKVWIPKVKWVVNLGLTL